MAAAAIASAHAGCETTRPAPKAPPAAREVAGRAESLPLSSYSTGELFGFTVLFHPDASRGTLRSRRVQAALLTDLGMIASCVPAPALAVLRESPIVITPTSAPRPGFTGRGMCFHESADWLTGHGFDAAREGTVEICDMDDFLLWRAEQPWMTFHELAHAYHGRLGFDRADVIAAHAAARDAGLYRAVPYVLAPEGEGRDAYAITNHKEYFAELSEALFGRNDYFPLTRDELRAYDPAGFALVTRLWNLSADEIVRERAGARPGAER